MPSGRSASARDATSGITWGADAVEVQGQVRIGRRSGRDDVVVGHVEGHDLDAQVAIADGLAPRPDRRAGLDAGEGVRIEARRDRAGVLVDPVGRPDLAPGDRLRRAVEMDQHGRGEGADRRRGHEDHEDRGKARSLGRPAHRQDRDEVAPAAGERGQQPHRIRQDANHDEGGGHPDERRDRGQQRVGLGQATGAARPSHASLAQEDGAGHGKPHHEPLEEEPSSGRAAWHEGLADGSERGPARGGNRGDDEEHDRDDGHRDPRGEAREDGVGRHEDERAGDRQGGHGPAEDDPLGHDRRHDLEERRTPAPGQRERRAAPSGGEHGDEPERPGGDGRRPDRADRQDRRRR